MKSSSMKHSWKVFLNYGQLCNWLDEHSEIVVVGVTENRHDEIILVYKALKP